MLQIIDRNKENFLVPSTARQMHFPAGEAHITNLEESSPEMAFIQGCDPDDLIMLAMAADTATQKGKPFTALMPYLPGARADRGTPFGAKVYANMINAMNISQIVCFDPHSPIIVGLLKKVTILETVEVLKRTILNGTIDYTGIISPDEGSRERSGRIAAAVGLPMIKASKHRDFKTGKLSGFSCEELPDPKGRYLVVDDICDGGGTFVGLAETIGLPKEQLDLWVSHGVFSARSERLRTTYGQVFTTNSHPGHANPEVNAQVIDLLPFLLEAAQ